MASEHRSLIADEQIPLTLVLDGDAKQADVTSEIWQTMPLSSAGGIWCRWADAIAQSCPKSPFISANSTQWFKASQAQVQSTFIPLTTLHSGWLRN